MAIIKNNDDFKRITSSITSFSHAYIINTNSLSKCYKYAKEFAKMIICGNNYDINNPDNQNICYKIDHDEFDDFYIVNPETIGINNSEIMNLLSYMNTKSLRKDGKRVYLIYGFERITSEISNKILKFLEEPNDNIYGILMTENIEKLLPTIISRCQILNFTFIDEEINNEIFFKMQKFMDFLIQNGNITIANLYNYFNDGLNDRMIFYNYFGILEKIISKNITSRIYNVEDENRIKALDKYDISALINILNITNKLKTLIKRNINLNLLLDRYIIEVTKELRT